MRKLNGMDVAVGVVLVVLVGLMVFCAVEYTIQTSIDWHDTGTVTSVQHLSYYSDDYQEYRSYYTANVTTLQHGVITFDSRFPCYFFFTPCASSDVQSWTVGQHLGIEHHHEGYYTDEQL